MNGKLAIFFAVFAACILLLSGCSWLGGKPNANTSDGQNQTGPTGPTGPGAPANWTPYQPPSNETPSGPSIPEIPKPNETVGFDYTYQPLADLKVCFIDVGLGDSVLVKKGDFEILVDGGSEVAGPRVSSFLDNQGVDDIEILALSSLTSDRVGGLPQVAAHYGIEEFWDNGASYLASDSDYNTLASVLKGKYTKMLHPTRGYHIYENGMSIDVLNPAADRFNRADNPEADSLTILIKDRNFSIYLSDLTTNTQNNLLANNPNVTAKLVKISQHGGGSTGAEEQVGSFLLISKLKPEIAVVSVGPNTRDLPNPSILEAYHVHNVKVYRTDLNGTICITSNGYTYNVTVSK